MRVPARVSDWGSDPQDRPACQVLFDPEARFGYPAAGRPVPWARCPECRYSDDWWDCPADCRNGCRDYSGRSRNGYWDFQDFQDSRGIRDLQDETLDQVRDQNHQAE